MLDLHQISVAPVIIAATIAGVISMLGLIISKEQKVSDFRQAWIDALRAELATVITHAILLEGLKATGIKELAEAWKYSHDDFIQINKAIMSIRMRLNPEEDDCKVILSELTELEKALVEDPINSESIKNIEDSIVTHAHELLKREWERVKKGEKVYRITRYIATIVVALCLVTLFLGYVTAKDELPNNHQPDTAQDSPAAEYR